MTERLPTRPDAAIAAALGELELNGRKLKRLEQLAEAPCLDDFDQDLEHVEIGGLDMFEATTAIESVRAELRRERRHLEERLRCARMRAVVDRLEAIRSGRAAFSGRRHAH